MPAPSRPRLPLPVVLALAWLTLAASIALAADVPPPTLQGTLGVAWGDPRQGAGVTGGIRFFLADATGRSTEVAVADELVRMLGGLARIDRRQVEAVLDPQAGSAGGPPVVRVLRLAPTVGTEAALDVTGSQPWVSILCKFSDLATEPKALSYFQNMFDNTAPRLDHYWRELSYDAINVAGSTAAGWFVLPHPQTFYAPTPGSGSNADLTGLFNDCTAAANPFVDFSHGGTGGYQGINLMFNGNLDCCAWGGAHFATLDGVSKSWRTTWEPPWGYGSIGVMCHEMGHGFGLPHSNNADDDGWPYDNPWDVMSDSWGYTATDATYGTIGKHTISYHLNLLGWIPAGQRLDVTGDGSFSLTIDPLELAGTPHYRMAKITLDATRFYTVEVRDRVGTYDPNLPGHAVVLHQIDPSRGEPAWLVDPTAADDGDGEGGMWRVGECYDDAANSVHVCVDAAAGSGFQVTITKGLGTPIFADGFETGNTNAWSQTVP